MTHFSLDKTKKASTIKSATDRDQPSTHILTKDSQSYCCYRGIIVTSTKTDKEGHIEREGRKPFSTPPKHC